MNDAQSEAMLNHSDQACLFFYLAPHIWIKAGVEYDMGKLWDGAVVCNPYSDW
jgi:regulation of enolase protein 1 (concanavalin A-like superfamily)